MVLYNRAAYYQSIARSKVHGATRLVCFELAHRPQHNNICHPPCLLLLLLLPLLWRGVGIWGGRGEEGGEKREGGRGEEREEGERVRVEIGENKMGRREKERGKRIKN